MIEKENRVKKTIRMNEQIATLMREESDRTGKTETAIIHEALVAYFDDNTDQVIDRFLDRFDEKYSNYMTRLRFAAGTADKNSQLLLDITNSLLFYNGITDEAYLPVHRRKHGLVEQSENDLKDRIARNKERTDDKRYE